MSIPAPWSTQPPAGLNIVVDHTALLALGAGHQWLSRLIVGALAHDTFTVLAPALCVTAAVAQRPQLGDHIGGLAAITVLDLGFADANTAGALIADGTDWQHAHALTYARPSIEWPAGLPIASTTPTAYTGHDVRIIDLTQL